MSDLPRLFQVMAGGAHGGAETAFVDMCLAMAARGVPQMVATRPHTQRIGELRDAGIVVETLPFGGRFDWRTGPALRRMIAEFGPDIVQTWMARAAWKIPASGRGEKPYRVVSRLGGYYKMKYFRQSDAFVAITPDIRDYLIRGGVAPDRVRHINNFAETEADAAPVSRESLGTPEQAFALLSLSRLHTAKALDILIRAVAPLAGVHVWLAGEGPERAALEALAQASGAGDRIHFLGWRNDRSSLLRACDACVFPSRYEPFGTVFAQAWGAGVPVITSNADGPRQFVRDGEDGLIAPIDDVEALRAAIVRLKDDPALAAGLVQRGLARYRNEFTRERAAEQYLAFYRDVLDRPRLV